MPVPTRRFMLLSGVILAFVVIAILVVLAVIDSDPMSEFAYDVH